jgi:hypothetical protein
LFIAVLFSSASHAYAQARFESRERKLLSFVSNCVHCDDLAILRKEPQHPRIEFAHVAQFKQPFAKRFGQWLPVILPVPQFCKTSEQRREVARIACLQLVQKLLHRACSCCALVKLYSEVHVLLTSDLMWHGGSASEA